MYRVQKRKRGGRFFLLLFLCAFSVGLGIGYGGIKMRLQRAEEPLPQNTADARPTLSAAPSAEPEAERAASLPITVSEDEPTEAEHFFVMTQQGSVCVFRVEPSGDKRFSHKLAIEPDSLPAADKKMLEEGVFLDSKADLLAFCEDFSS